jgi:hypothetical protein
MLAAHREELLRRVSDGARVLDVGGWASPLARADWVIDLMPYETRGLYGGDPDPERFSAETWVRRDVCAREPWPFADDEFDFVVCAHTLEDVRDPVWVCEEVARVGRAGYVEFPSRLEEQTWGFDGPWSGWNHHRWLCEADREGNEVRFTFKYDLVHLEQFRFPPWFRDGLSAEQRVDWLWWEGGFAAREVIHMKPEELFAELQAFRDAHIGLVAPPARRRWPFSRG